jgi:hypothetical protein
MTLCVNAIMTAAEKVLMGSFIKAKRSGTG